MLKEALVTSYIAASPDVRRSLMQDFLQEQASNIQSCWEVLDCNSVDSQSCRAAIDATIAKDPYNLPARRIAAWLNTRDGHYAAAAEHLFLLSKLSLRHIGERRALLRLCYLDPSLVSEEILNTVTVGLNDPLAKASYEYQLYRATRDVDVLPEYVHNLQTAVKAVSEYLMAEIRAQGPKSPTSKLLDLFASAKRVAIVGNGPSLRKAGRGIEIDRYDLVVRCNFPIISGYSEDVGSRTDVIIFTEALFRLFDMYINRDPSYQKTLLCTISNKVAAAGLDPAEVVQSRGMTLAQIPSSALTHMQNLAYAQLTTGAQTYLLIAALLNKSVTLFGFDFYSQKELHYFPQSAGLWLAHEVQYEKFFFHEVVKPVFGAYYR